MTDEAQGSEISAQDSAPAVEVSDSPSAVESAPQESEKPVERTFTQTEVRRIAAKSKHEAYEKGKRDAEAMSQKAASLGGMDAMSEDKIRQLIQDESQRQANLAMAQKIADEFTQKMKAGEAKYPDFSEAVSDLNLPQVPHIVHWANGLDNTSDVMYDLAKNPAKFANVMMLSQTAPHLAQREMKRLSDSIKKNEEAKAQKLPDEPLSQMKHSPVSTDNGRYTVSDYRKMDWLRG